MVLHPLIQQGLQHRYYPIDDDLNPKWDELETLVDNNTKAIMMVHFFGQPQDISAFQSFCDHHDLLLIEDNAHGYGGSLNEQLLGTFGAIGISSPRKTLNTYSGGILWLKIKSNEIIHQPDLSPYPVSISQRIKTNLFNPYPSLKYSVKRAFKDQPKYEDPRTFRDPVRLDYSIDKKSAGIINKTDWVKLLKSRQKSYQKWQDFSLENELIPVFEKLHSQANPWCFPAYAKDQREAIKWFNWGWKNNVNIYPWPSLPEEILVKKGDSFNRWRKLICFGIT